LCSFKICCVFKERKDSHLYAFYDLQYLAYMSSIYSLTIPSLWLAPML
jgi:hypothetical protein